MCLVTLALTPTLTLTLALALALTLTLTLALTLTLTLSLTQPNQVIDEAHKATGQHAYVQAVRMLRERSGGFRVLALSATPGRDPMAVQQAG